MSSEKRTLTLVQFSYSDGTYECVENEDAEKWLKVVDNALVMDQIHGNVIDLPKMKHCEQKLNSGYCEDCDHCKKLLGILRQKPN